MAMTRREILIDGGGGGEDNSNANLQISGGAVIRQDDDDNGDATNVISDDAGVREQEIQRQLHYRARYNSSMMNSRKEQLKEDVDTA